MTDTAKLGPAAKEPTGSLLRLYERLPGPAPSRWRALAVSAKLIGKAKRGEQVVLSDVQVERLVAIEEVLSMAVEVFGTEEAARAWIGSEHVALNFKSPMELLSAQAGRAQLKQAMGRVLYGLCA